MDRKGHHWNLWIDVPGAADRASLGQTEARSLEGRLEHHCRGPRRSSLVVAHYQQDGVDTWANAVVNNSYSPIRVFWDVIKIVPPPFTLTLVEPSATPEKMPTGRRGDFPFLTPFPNLTARDGEDYNTPFRLEPIGSNQDEIVASGSMVRPYSHKNLSVLLFGTAYRDALTKAGWDVDQAAPDSGTITAHYSKNGRNLWAYLAYRGGDN